MISIEQLIYSALIPGVLALLGLWLWRVPHRGQALFARDEASAHWLSGVSFAAWVGLVAVLCLLLLNGSSAWPPRESPRAMPLGVLVLSIVALISVRLLTPVDGKHRRYVFMLPIASLVLAGLATIAAHYTAFEWPRWLMLGQIVLGGVALFGVFEASRRESISAAAVVLLCSFASAALIAQRGSLPLGISAGVIVAVGFSSVMLAVVRGVSTPAVWWAHAVLVYLLVLSHTWYSSPLYAIAGVALAPLWLLLPGRKSWMIPVRLGLVLVTLAASVAPSFLPDGETSGEDDGSSMYSMAN